MGHSLVMEAVAGTTAAAVAGIVALTLELVQAGVISVDAGQRVSDAMVGSLERNAARHETTDAMGNGIVHMALVAE